MKIVRLATLGFAAIAIGTSAWSQNGQSTTWHICTLSDRSYQTLALTEPFPYSPSHDAGMGRLNDSWQDFIWRLSRGKVDAAFDVKQMSGGTCHAGSRDRASAEEFYSRLRARNPNAVSIKAPMDREGDLPSLNSAPATTKKTDGPLGPPTTAPQERAVKVETPSGTVLMTPRKKAEYESKLAEHQRQLVEREKAIADAAAKHEANRRAADERVAQHNKELTKHAEKVAQMERDAAAVRAEWAMRAAGLTPEQKDDERVEFKEGIVLCRQPNPSSKSWSCQGPLQNTSAVLDTPNMTVALGQACGSDRSIRDLGMVKGYRAFGCGFGIHPTARDYPGNTDVPAKLGIDFIPGRRSYTCPKSKLAYCRG